MQDLSNFKLGGGGQVLSFIRTDQWRESIWLCECGCGTKFESERRVILGRPNQRKLPLFGCKSCAHKQRGINSRKTLLMINKTFGRLTVLKEHSIDKKRHVKYLCQCICGNTSIVLGPSLRRGLTKSCGCLHKEIARERFTGSNHPCWVEDPDPRRKARLDRASKKWLDLKKSVWTRDNYTCLKCQIRGGKLTAHHCDGWSWCILGRFASDNVVTLCVACHYEYHRIYGMKKVKREDFRHFVSNFI